LRARVLLAGVGAAVLAAVARAQRILGSEAREGGGEPDDRAFPTEGGGRRDNTGLGMLLKAVFELAEGLLRDRGQQPLPRGLSPHKLRHTFGSILVALGEDPISVMAQLGSPSLHLPSRRPRSADALPFKAANMRATDL
jgi:integrase